MAKLEPISPVSPVHMDTDLDLVPARFSKEELIQNMERVDREITMVEQQICKLRKKQVGAVRDLRELPDGIWLLCGSRRFSFHSLSGLIYDC